MCGRYSLALRPSQVREHLENEHMPVYEAPDDDGASSPRQSYNFAPGYHGIVYRAEMPVRGSGVEQHHEGDTEQPASEDPTQGNGQREIRYKLQSMKWGLIPFWTKRNPNYGSLMKTINCRDDSLQKSGGMWTTMKQNKRCIVVAQGFYEWLKKGKERLPYYVKRKDGQLMCFAGLWDCVQYEDSEEKLYTYTIITTDSNKQLKFLHDRMPVILENGSQDQRTWLDPNRTWSKELQALLKPFSGEVDVYRVSQDVGKVGNNSPTFIVPLTSSQNKSSITNFFTKAATTRDSNIGTSTKTEREKHEASSVKLEPTDNGETGTGSLAQMLLPKTETERGVKRELDNVPTETNPKKVQRTTPRTQIITRNK